MRRSARGHARRIGAARRRARQQRTAPAHRAAGSATILAPGSARPGRPGRDRPVDYERQLDPRSMKDARVLAEDMYKSTMFSSYGSPQAVLSTVMVGRELGLPAMASLRSIHNIEGRHGLSASLMVALVLKSGTGRVLRAGLVQRPRKRPTRRSARARATPSPHAHDRDGAGRPGRRGRRPTERLRRRSRVRSRAAGAATRRTCSSPARRRGWPAWSTRTCSPASTRRKNSRKSATNRQGAA
jgi:hypothetical protein